MNKERIDDLVDILSERTGATENTLLIRNQQELLKYIENPTQWKTQQFNNLKKYKQEVLKIAKDEIDKVKISAVKVMLVGYQEVSKDNIEITKTEIKARVPKSVKTMIDNFADKTANEIVALAQLAINEHKQNVKIVSSLATPDNLYTTIKNQMERGVDKGFKVVYKDGKQFSWKAYMEMKVRTDVHQELAKEQVRAGAQIGVIFYMCDILGDSADDHADYQGKIYYNADANIPDVVQKYIDANGILSMQEVMDGPPYLTTRPNCRHNFHAIPTEDVLIDTEAEIANNENLIKGDYKESNYAKVQEQRLNERTIRKYKLRAQTANALYQATNDASYLQKAQRANAKIKEWQGRNRNLIANNPDLLQRDSDRENIRVITQDLGVRYDYTFDAENDNTPTPTTPAQAYSQASSQAKQTKKEKVVPTPAVPVSAVADKTLDAITPAVKGADLLNQVYLGDVYDKKRKDDALWIRFDETKGRGYEAIREFEQKIKNNFGQSFVDAVNNGTLTKEQMSVLTEYTGQAFTRINFFLRRDRDFEKFSKLGMYDGYAKSEIKDDFDLTKQQVSVMESFFNQDKPEVKLKQDTWVQRGIDDRNLLRLLGATEQQLEDLRYIKYDTDKKPYIEGFTKIAEGKTFEEKGYLSVGVAKGKGFTFAGAVINIFVPKDTKAVYVAPISKFGGVPNLKNAKNLSLNDLSTSGGEGEMIIDKGKKLHITKVEFSVKDNQWYLDAEMIDD